MKRITPIDALRVFAKEKRVERIQRKRKRIAMQINHLQAEISDLEDLDQALSGREGDLEHEIEMSGVFE